MWIIKSSLPIRDPAGGEEVKRHPGLSPGRLMEVSNLVGCKVVEACETEAGWNGPFSRQNGLQSDSAVWRLSAFLRTRLFLAFHFGSHMSPSRSWGISRCMGWRERQVHRGCPTYFILRVYRVIGGIEPKWEAQISEVSFFYFSSLGLVDLGWSVKLILFGIHCGSGLIIFSGIV